MRGIDQPELGCEYEPLQSVAHVNTAVNQHIINDQIQYIDLQFP